MRYVRRNVEDVTGGQFERTSARDRIAGVVLNRVERKRITPEYGYYEAVNHAV